MRFIANGIDKDLIAFDCMMSNVGDVAFVNLKSIEGKIGKLFYKSIFFSYFILNLLFLKFIILGNLVQKRGNQARNTKYRTLCLNQIDSDEMCLLTWAPLGMVIPL